MSNKTLKLFCVYLIYFRYFWNINGTYEMNQKMQNGTMSKLYNDDKKS